MKKVTAILFSAFYLIATIGVAVNIHYCHGEVESVSVYEDPTGCCCDTKENGSGCCSNESFVLQFEDKEQIVENHRIQIQIHTMEVDISDLTIQRLEDIHESEGFEYIFQPPPPKLSGQIRILNCSLTYYG